MPVHSKQWMFRQYYLKLIYKNSLQEHGLLTFRVKCLLNISSRIIMWIWFCWWLKVEYCQFITLITLIQSNHYTSKMNQLLDSQKWIGIPLRLIMLVTAIVIQYIRQKEYFAELTQECLRNIIYLQLMSSSMRCM